MKKVVLMFIPALICGMMLTSFGSINAESQIVPCEMEKAFRKWVYDRLKGDEIISSSVNDEIVSCDMEETFRKWVHDRIKGDVVVRYNVTSDEMESCEMEEAFRKWVHDKIRERL